MTTKNIFLADSMKAYVDQRVSQGGDGMSNKYFCELTWRNKDRSQMCALMLTGLKPPVAGPADTAYF